MRLTVRQSASNAKLCADKAIEQEAHLKDLAQAQRANTAKKKAMSVRTSWRSPSRLTHRTQMS